MYGRKAAVPPQNTKKDTHILTRAPLGVLIYVLIRAVKLSGRMGEIITIFIVSFFLDLKSAVYEQTGTFSKIHQRLSAIWRFARL